MKRYSTLGAAALLLLLCSSCSTSHSYFIKGLNHDQVKDYGGALTNYTKAIETCTNKNDPIVLDASLHRPRDKFQLRDYLVAVADYDHFLRLDPRFNPDHARRYAAQIYFERGNANFSANRFSEAI